MIGYKEVKNMINKNVQKMNGGGCYDRLQSIICAIALYLVLIRVVIVILLSIQKKLKQWI